MSVAEHLSTLPVPNFFALQLGFIERQRKAGCLSLSCLVTSGYWTVNHFPGYVYTCALCAERCECRRKPSLLWNVVCFYGRSWLYVRYVLWRVQGNVIGGGSPSIYKARVEPCLCDCVVNSTMYGDGSSVYGNVRIFDRASSIHTLLVNLSSRMVRNMVM